MEKVCLQRPGYKPQGDEIGNPFLKAHRNEQTGIMYHIYGYNLPLKLAKKEPHVTPSWKRNTIEE